MIRHPEAPEVAINRPVPLEVLAFLNAQSLSHQPIERVHVDFQTPANPVACPECASRLGSVNLYCGSRGYVPFDICTNEDCAFERRAS